MLSSPRHTASLKCQKADSINSLGRPVSWDKLQEAQNRAEGLKKRLANDSYVKQAPKQLVEETKQQLQETEALAQNIQREIQRFAQ